MKTQNQPTEMRNGLFTVLTLLVMAVAPPSRAADRIWNGGGDQFSWSDPANWGGIAPGSGDSLFFDGTQGLYANNDLPAQTTIAGLTFLEGAGSFFLTGNEVNLAGGVTNLSPNPQSISLNLNQTGNRIHHSVGDLLYDGQVKNNTLIKWGPGTITLGGSLENNSLRAQVYEGVLQLAKQGARALPASPIVVANQGILRIVAGVTTDQIHFNQRVVVTNGGRFQIQNTFEEIASLSGSTDADGIVENGLEGSSSRLDIGGGSGHRGIFSGTIRDGAGVFNLRVYRHNNIQVFNGTHTYTGTTEVYNTTEAGITRMIVNGTHVGGGPYTVYGHSTQADRKAALGGAGSLTAASFEIRTRGSLSPGGELSADLTDNATFHDTPAILTLAGPVALDGGSLEIELNGLAAGTGYDQVRIRAPGALTLANADLQLRLGFTPEPGSRFTIVEVEGTDPTLTTGVFATLNGGPADLSHGAAFVDPASGVAFRISYHAEGSSFDAGGNDIMLEVIEPPGGNRLTWRGDGLQNLWDRGVTANWWDGSSLRTFQDGDIVTFDDSGSNNVPVQLVGDLSPARVWFGNAGDYVLDGSGRLVGAVLLTKTNQGTVTILTDNDTSGSTIIREGTIRLGTNGLTGWLPGRINIESGGILRIERADDVVVTNGDWTGRGALVHAGSGSLIFTANLNESFNGWLTNQGGLLQFGDGMSASGTIGGVVHLPQGHKVRYAYSGGNGTIYNAFSGAGTIEIDHATGGRFEIAASAVSSNFQGTILVRNGVLKTADGNQGYALGNGSTVIVSNYNQVWLDRSATTYNQTFLIEGKRLDDFPGFPGEPVLRMFGCTLDGAIVLMGDARLGGTISSATIRAPISGPYELDVFGNEDYQLFMGPDHGEHTYASTRVTRGWIVALNDRAISPGPLILDAAGGLRLNGNRLAVSRLADVNTGLVTGRGARVENGHATQPATLVVGSDGADFTFGDLGGIFADGGTAPLHVTKVGTGTFTVTGVNSNSGVVTVEQGTLALSGAGAFPGVSAFVVNGMLDVAGIGGTLSLSAGQTLTGEGTVQGNVYAPPGAVMAPGHPVGTLTVSGNVILEGLLVLELDRDHTPLPCDRLASTVGTLSYNGSLLVTNVGAPLQVGDTFPLFPSGVTGFTGPIILATNDVHGYTYTWQNDIATLGSITVVAVTPPATPPALSVRREADATEISWPAENLGWVLQVQTNSLQTGLGTNWITIGFGSTNLVRLPIDPAAPAVFYRLTLPRE